MVREKLIELLDDIQQSGTSYEDYEIYGMRIPDTVGNDKVADHLIANNVTVREKGEWIVQNEGRTRFMCSNCKSENHPGGHLFCCVCGADMR